MADTRNPDVLFWTNDENGLRLHGFMDEDGIMTAFDPPLLLADSTCSVGDTQEGTYIFDEEYNYTLELAGVETITVPAGTFRNCLKFVYHTWPSSELPSLYGYETFWLAKNVGFVKGMADENAVNHLFTENSETRQLLNYHITSSEMTADEQAIREASDQLFEALEDGNLGDALALVSEDYMAQGLDNTCWDKDALEAAWINFFDMTSDRRFFITVEDMQVNGVDAYVLIERLWTDEHISLGRRWRWDRQTIRWKKENGDWKNYGDHLGFRSDWVSVWIENANGSLNNWIEADFIDCQTNDYLESAADISSLTVTGPPGSGIGELDLKNYWLEAYHVFWRGDVPVNVASGFYTFRVENQNGDYYIGTDYLEATPPMDLPILVSPQNLAENVSPDNVNLDWEDVAAAGYYRIDLVYYDNGIGPYVTGFPVYLTGSAYTIPIDLAPNTKYSWRIRARRNDLYDNLDNESRSDWNYFTKSGG